MKRTWEVDENTIVEARYGAFSKKNITVNGETVHRKLNVGKKREIKFPLLEGRMASLSVRPQFAGQPIIELRVDGHSMVETPKEAIHCRACGAPAKPYDRFCNECGQAMPTAEDYANNKQVKEATKTMYTLAVLFLLSGFLMYFLTKSQLATALAKLQTMDPQSTFPTPINGVTYTVAALKQQISWQPWGVLIVNLILAGVMGLLALWSKRAPLAAVLVATATYAAVVVVNAIIDPTTISQGLFVKIIVAVCLVRGIKASLVLRAANG